MAVSSVVFPLTARTRLLVATAVSTTALCVVTLLTAAIISFPPFMMPIPAMLGFLLTVLATSLLWIEVISTPAGSVLVRVAVLSSCGAGLLYLSAFAGFSWGFCHYDNICSLFTSWNLWSALLFLMSSNLWNILLFPAGFLLLVVSFLVPVKRKID